MACPGAVATASLPVWRGPQLGASSHQSRMRAIPTPRCPWETAGDPGEAGSGLTDLWPPEDGQARAPALGSRGGLQGHAPFLSFVPPLPRSLREGASCRPSLRLNGANSLEPLAAACSPGEGRGGRRQEALERLELSGERLVWRIQTRTPSPSQAFTGGRPVSCTTDHGLEAGGLAALSHCRRKGPRDC